MDDPQTVPFAAFEAQAERSVRTLKYMSLGWVISVALLVFLLLVSIIYEVETVTETTEVAQQADNNGSNYYAGGDYYGDQADN